jgi:1-acyl-sn-glycerol-3-phosphate acyltransferase
MNRVDVAWFIGRRTISPTTRAFVPMRSYGGERVPLAGGVVIAVNHFAWIDIPIVGTLSPRYLDFVAKVEAHRVAGLGQVIRAFGTISVRRGESDRDAVRAMRESVRNARALGLFVEGTRQRSGVPGRAQPGAAMVAIQEQVPVVPAAIHGTQGWKLGNWAPASVAWGLPLRFDDLPRNSKGYREATAQIEREIRRLWEWLVGIHALDRRPRIATPPT